MPIETLTDASELSELVDNWMVESQRGLAELGMTTDKETYLGNLQKFIDSPISDVLVSRSNHEITGMMVMIQSPSIVGPDVNATELYFYVSPRFRGLAGLRLMKAAVKWALDRGCTHLMMSSSKPAGKMFDKVCRLYESFGMKYVEAGYIKRLEG